MKYLGVTLAILIATGCASHSDITNSDPQRIFTLDKNYQLVYRDTKQAFACGDGSWAGVFATNNIDAELYGALGFAELQHRMNNFGVDTYYWRVLLEDAGDNETTVTIRSTINGEKSANFVESVIRGNDSPCGQTGYHPLGTSS